jgi:hypothetical protein
MRGTSSQSPRYVRPSLSARCQRPALAALTYVDIVTQFVAVDRHAGSTQR